MTTIPDERSGDFNPIRVLLDALLGLTMKKADFDKAVASIDLAPSAVSEDPVRARLQRTSFWIKGWSKIFIHDVSNEAAFCRYTFVIQNIL